MNTHLDFEHYKELLLKEKDQLIGDLGKIAKIDPTNKKDWIPTPPENDTVIADKNDMSDKFEEFGQRQSTERSLETRLQHINRALDSIKEGTYGFCEVDDVDKHLIREDRLKANPAATTCIDHTS